MKQKSLKKLQQQVDDFNSKVAIGQKVQIKMWEDGEWQEATVSHPATILSGHSAVGWFEEVRGCHSLDFVKY